MFKLSPADRIKVWKKFRCQIDLLPEMQAIEATQQFWQKCPFTPFYLDPSDPTSWPSPWELIIDNYYCEIAKVLGIVYTLHLTLHQKTINPEIRIYHDLKNKLEYPIAYLCNGKYVVNLVEGAIVNKEHINKELKLKHCYTAVELNLEQY